MILFADYNTPYLFAISFVLLIGLLEIFALICGHMLSGALDAHLDHYDSITTGHISQALLYLNIGRLPALVVLCLLRTWHSSATLWYCSQLRYECHLFNLHLDASGGQQNGLHYLH
ncbi:YqiJ family protein [Klebsiella pneumoniae]|nr:Inner membrane protein yqiJ [Klebsiella quasipneumoniae]SSH50118.1 Inner membrane protein yqiJ [Klebsiella quasipneumoniae]SSK05581.1 Inner membrane protein yqiJ [Klebsiella pneumoniae]HDH1444474.1 DUF1449 family protein [Klebsiella quasipneumoniae subsp. similipneumoniae]